jgi:hypothetical protein
MTGLPCYPGGTDPPPANERSPGWLALVIGGGALAWVMAAGVLGLFGVVVIALPLIVGQALVALVGIALYETTDGRP